MDQSFDTILDSECPYCGKSFVLTTWLIIDAAERPELLEWLRSGRLREAHCPQCDETFVVDAPLLLYRRRDIPAILFSPANGTPDEQSREQALLLFSLLRQRLQASTGQQVQVTGIHRVPRALLAKILESGFEQTQSEGSIADPTPDILGEFIAAETWASSQRILARRPELLSAQVAAMLDEAIVSARAKHQARNAAAYEEHRSLLRKCREVGVAVAFAEKTVAGGQFARKLYMVMFEIDKAGQLSDWARCVQLCRGALALVTEEQNALQWAELQCKLGSALLQDHLGERAENIEAGIKCIKKALQVYTPSTFPMDWATSQHELATAYFQRIRGNRAENLEEAISGFNKALAIRTRQDYPELWADTEYNLAAAYTERIRGEQAENLETAIHLFHGVLDVYTRQADAARWAMVQNALGNAYLRRVRGVRTENLDKAIACYERSLEVRTRERFPADWAMSHSNLTNAYAQRRQSDKVENVELAINRYHQALEVRTRHAFPEEWAAVQLNLGLAYAERRQGDRTENLRQAIYHYQQCLEVYTRRAFPENFAMAHHALGNAYADMLLNDQTTNVLLAIQSYKQSLEVYDLHQYPKAHGRTQRSLGNLYFDEGDWRQAHDAYAAATKGGEALLAAAYTEAGRRAEVEETSREYIRDAYCLLRLGRPADALLRLERGKTRLLAEVLALIGADLAGLPDAQRQSIQELRQAIRELEAEDRMLGNTPARRFERKLGEELRVARARLNFITQGIRAERPEFLSAGLDLSSLLAQIPQRGALVAPLLTSEGSAVFVLPDGVREVTDAHVIRLDDFTEADLRFQLHGTDEAEPGGWLGTYFSQRGNPNGWLNTIETTTRMLWDELLGPVYKYLRSAGLAEGASVLLMPQGGLGVLPLHAAWREMDGVKRAFLDDYTVSYAPSGYAHSVSQRRLREPQRQRRSLLLVINSGSDLIFAPSEGLAVMNLFDKETSQALAEADATPDAVIEAARERSYLHFACHGFYASKDAMQSGLQLAGPTPLTLAKVIAELDLGATRLVTLSACETGLTEVGRSPDEYVGLPAGFLLAGAPAVVSTLWSVVDVSTMLMMERFYQFHLVGKLAPAAALRKAQLWLRDVTSAKLGELFREHLRTAPGRSYMPEKVARKYFRKFTLDPRDKRPFSHPFYWAGFTFSGA